MATGCIRSRARNKGEHRDPRAEGLCDGGPSANERSGGAVSPGATMRRGRASCSDVKEVSQTDSGMGTTPHTHLLGLYSNLAGPSPGVTLTHTHRVTRPAIRPPTAPAPANQATSPAIWGSRVRAPGRGPELEANLRKISNNTMELASLNRDSPSSTMASSSGAPPGRRKGGKGGGRAGSVDGTIHTSA